MNGYSAAIEARSLRDDLRLAQNTITALDAALKIREAEITDLKRRLVQAESKVAEHSAKLDERAKEPA